MEKHILKGGGGVRILRIVVLLQTFLKYVTCSIKIKLIWKLSLIDVVSYNKNNGLKIPMILIFTVTVQKCELMWTKGNRYQHLNYELFV